MTTTSRHPEDQRLRKKSDDHSRSSTILATIGEQLVEIIRLEWNYSLKALIVLLLLILNVSRVSSQVCFPFDDLSCSNEDSSLSPRLKRRSLPQYHQPELGSTGRSFRLEFALSSSARKTSLFLFSPT
jgi:hypothetical protein